MLCHGRIRRLALLAHAVLGCLPADSLRVSTPAGQQNGTDPSCCCCHLQPLRDSVTPLASPALPFSGRNSAAASPCHNGSDSSDASLARLVPVVIETTHLQLLETMKTRKVFVTLYTTWCINCVHWLGGPLQSLIRRVHKEGVQDQLDILKVNIEQPGYDDPAMHAAGFQHAFVPALFAVKPGERPVLYEGMSVAPTAVLFDWLNRPQLVDGHYVQIVLQMRVKPSAIRPVSDPKATEFERKYWVINDRECLRPYGVLIRELSLQDYIPPEAMVYGFDHPTVKQLLQDIRAGK